MVPKNENSTKMGIYQDTAELQNRELQRLAILNKYEAYIMKIIAQNQISIINRTYPDNRLSTKFLEYIQSITQFLINYNRTIYEKCSKFPYSSSLMEFLEMYVALEHDSMIKLMKDRRSVEHRVLELLHKMFRHRPKVQKYIVLSVVVNAKNDHGLTRSFCMEFITKTEKEMLWENRNNNLTIGRALLAKVWINPHLKLLTQQYDSSYEDSDLDMDQNIKEERNKFHRKRRKLERPQKQLPKSCNKVHLDTKSASIKKEIVAEPKIERRSWREHSATRVNLEDVKNVQIKSEMSFSETVIKHERNDYDDSSSSVDRADSFYNRRNACDEHTLGNSNGHFTNSKEDGGHSGGGGQQNHSTNIGLNCSNLKRDKEIADVVPSERTSHSDISKNSGNSVKTIFKQLMDELKANALKRNRIEDESNQSNAKAINKYNKKNHPNTDLQLGEPSRKSEFSVPKSDNAQSDAADMNLSESSNKNSDIPIKIIVKIALLPEELENNAKVIDNTLVLENSNVRIAPVEIEADRSFPEETNDRKHKLKILEPSIQNQQSELPIQVIVKAVSNPEVKAITKEKSKEKEVSTNNLTLEIDILESSKRNNEEVKLKEVSDEKVNLEITSTEIIAEGRTKDISAPADGINSPKNICDKEVQETANEERILVDANPDVEQTITNIPQTRCDAPVLLVNQDQERSQLKCFDEDSEIGLDSSLGNISDILNTSELSEEGLLNKSYLEMLADTAVSVDVRKSDESVSKITEVEAHESTTELEGVKIVQEPDCKNVSIDIFEETLNENESLKILTTNSNVTPSECTDNIDMSFEQNLNLNHGKLSLEETAVEIDSRKLIEKLEEYSEERTQPKFDEVIENESESKDAEVNKSDVSKEDDDSKIKENEIMEEQEAIICNVVIDETCSNINENQCVEIFNNELTEENDKSPIPSSFEEDNKQSDELKESIETTENISENVIECSMNDVDKELIQENEHLDNSAKPIFDGDVTKCNVPMQIESSAEIIDDTLVENLVVEESITSNKDVEEIINPSQENPEEISDNKVTEICDDYLPMVESQVNIDSKVIDVIEEKNFDIVMLSENADVANQNQPINYAMERNQHTENIEEYENAVKNVVQDVLQTGENNTNYNEMVEPLVEIVEESKEASEIDLLVSVEKVKEIVENEIKEMIQVGVNENDVLEVKGNVETELKEKYQVEIKEMDEIEIKEKGELENKQNEEVEVKEDEKIVLKEKDQVEVKEKDEIELKEKDQVEFKGMDEIIGTEKDQLVLLEKDDVEVQEKDELEKTLMMDNQFFLHDKDEEQSDDSDKLVIEEVAESFDQENILEQSNAENIRQEQNLIVAETVNMIEKSNEGETNASIQFMEEKYHLENSLITDKCISDICETSILDNNLITSEFVNFQEEVAVEVEIACEEVVDFPVNIQQTSDEKLTEIVAEEIDNPKEDMKKLDEPKLEDIARKDEFNVEVIQNQNLMPELTKEEVIVNSGNNIEKLVQKIKHRLVDNLVKGNSTETQIISDQNKSLASTRRNRRNGRKSTSKGNQLDIYLMPTLVKEVDSEKEVSIENNLDKSKKQIETKLNPEVKDDRVSKIPKEAKLDFRPDFDQQSKSPNKSQEIIKLPKELQKSFEHIKNYAQRYCGSKKRVPNIEHILKSENLFSGVQRRSQILEASMSAENHPILPKDLGNAMIEKPIITNNELSNKLIVDKSKKTDERKSSDNIRHRTEKSLETTKSNSKLAHDSDNKSKKYSSNTSSKRKHDSKTKEIDESKSIKRIRSETCLNLENSIKIMEENRNRHSRSVSSEKLTSNVKEWEKPNRDKSRQVEGSRKSVDKDLDKRERESSRSLKRKSSSDLKSVESKSRKTSSTESKRTSKDRDSIPAISLNSSCCKSRDSESSKESLGTATFATEKTSDVKRKDEMKNTINNLISEKSENSCIFRFKKRERNESLSYSDVPDDKNKRHSRSRSLEKSTKDKRKRDEKTESKRKSVDKEAEKLAKSSPKYLKKKSSSLELKTSEMKLSDTNKIVASLTSESKIVKKMTKEECDGNSSELKSVKIPQNEKISYVDQYLLRQREMHIKDNLTYKLEDSQPFSEIVWHNEERYSKTHSPKSTQLDTTPEVKSEEIFRSRSKSVEIDNLKDVRCEEIESDSGISCLTTTKSMGTITEISEDELNMSEVSPHVRQTYDVKEEPICESIEKRTEDNSNPIAVAEVACELTEIKVEEMDSCKEPGKSSKKEVSKGCNKANEETGKGLETLKSYTESLLKSLGKSNESAGVVKRELDKDQMSSSSGVTQPLSFEDFQTYADFMGDDEDDDIKSQRSRKLFGDLSFGDSLKCDNPSQSQVFDYEPKLYGFGSLPCVKDSIVYDTNFMQDKVPEDIIESQKSVDSLKIIESISMNFAPGKESEKDEEEEDDGSRDDDEEEQEDEAVDEGENDRGREMDEVSLDHTYIKPKLEIEEIPEMVISSDMQIGDPIILDEEIVQDNSSLGVCFNPTRDYSYVENIVNVPSVEHLLSENQFSTSEFVSEFCDVFDGGLELKNISPMKPVEHRHKNPDKSSKVESAVTLPLPRYKRTKVKAPPKKSPNS